MLSSLKFVSRKNQTLLDVFLRWLAPLGLGLFLGMLVAKGAWYYAIGMLLMVPFAIALISRPFLGIILWLLVMPFIGILPNPAMMYWFFHRILIVLVLALTIINNRWRETDKHVQLKLPDIAVLTLVGFVPILIIASQTDLYQPLINGVDRILIPLLIYISIRLNPLDKEDNKLLLWTVLFVAVSQGLIGLMSIFAPGVLPSSLQAYRQGYASGTLANPNVYAIALVFCALLLFESAMKRQPGWVRYLFLLACGLCVIGVFFSMERAAWLSLALVLLGLLWIYPKPMIRFLLTGGIVIGGLLAAGFLSKYIGSASDRLNHNQPVYDRIVVSDAMIQMVKEKPVFGWGYETLNTNIAQYYRTLGAARIARGLVTSHNTYLTIVTEQGLITLLLYLFPVLWLLVKSILDRRRISREGKWHKSMLVVLWLAALNYFITSNFLDIRFFPYGIGLWWLTLGLIANIVAPMVGSSTAPIEDRENISLLDESDFNRGYNPNFQNG